MAVQKFRNIFADSSYSIWQSVVVHPQRRRRLLPAAPWAFWHNVRDDQVGRRNDCFGSLPCSVVGMGKYRITDYTEMTPVDRSSRQPSLPMTQSSVLYSHQTDAPSSPIYCSCSRLLNLYVDAWSSNRQIPVALSI